MKKLLIAALLVVSTQSFAKVLATHAALDLFVPGVYTGLNDGKECSLKVAVTDGSVSFSVVNTDSSAAFVLLNSSSNYSVDEETGEITANQSAKYPYYVHGATKLLNVKEKNGVAHVYIATIAFDHKGNDASTYNACAVEL